ncbi:MAG TPA: polysaccharide biosynthesis/export family protein [Bryobacteraceae bacterium]
MRTAILSAFLALLPALSHGGDDPKPAAGRQAQTRGATSSQDSSGTQGSEPPARPATPPNGETNPAKLAPASPAAGARLPGAAPINEKTYVIGPEDVLGILVWGNAPLSGSVTVRPDGMITLGLINEVRAAGQTPEQLTNEITERLRAGGYMQAPRVTVAVQQVNSKKACIVGEVLKPGCFNLVVPTTVLEALVNAGGFKDFANQKNIAIQRGNQRFLFNYKRVIAGKNREQNIPLEPGDLIIVK